MNNRLMRLLVPICALAMLAAACTSGTDTTTNQADGVDSVLGDPGDCIVVDMAVSSEKIDLLTDLAVEFNSSGIEVNGNCVSVQPQSKASGGAMQLLAAGWDEDIEGPLPVVWSPASSAWGAILNQRLSAKGEPEIVDDFQPFMLTPLVIAMPKPMAEALGWPETPIGWADILTLARDAAGWGTFDHPEWGPFRLGKTNPNFSTSGLSALIAQTYAAAGTTSGLSSEDLANPAVIDFATGVESAVVHYGDTTLTFLNNWYRTDQRGTSLTYASAAAVEEVSIIQYNRGNPDGRLDPGEEPEPPRIPLVAVYPKEGTLFSDNPYIILNADWVDDDEKAAAELFRDFVLKPENQSRVLDFGFRPGNATVAVGAPINAANGVDPNEPQTTLEVPDPPVMVELLDRWSDQRKPARVQLVVDVSGSMGEAAGAGTNETKLDLAKRAAIDALDEFAPKDEVGLRIFTGDIDGQGASYLDLVDISPIAANREELVRRIGSLTPLNGTPLYTAIGDSFDLIQSEFDVAKINAVVVLTDGRNEDDNNDLDGLLEKLRQSSEGATSNPVRVFPIAYGADADLTTLRRIAEAANAAVYDASDPATISKVFTAVISNF